MMIDDDNYDNELNDVLPRYAARHSDRNLNMHNTNEETT